jgi:hypothetical protein
VRPLGVKLFREGVEAVLLLQAVHARRTGGFLLEPAMHALVAAVLLRLARLMRSISMPSLSHQTASLGRLKSALGLPKRTSSERIACGRPRSANGCAKAVRRPRGWRGSASGPCG